MIQQESLSQEKRLIRKNILARRNALPLEVRQRSNMAMADRIIGHQWFYKAEVLLAFVNYGSEISTEEIIQEALRKGKKVFVPKVEGTDMVFYRINSLDELQSGYKGIREPGGATERFVYEDYEDKNLLILMPGVAFDIYGNRLGYGKGFYDRYIADKPKLQIYSIGIGYKCQQVEQLPVDELDRKPYQVILM